MKNQTLPEELSDETAVPPPEEPGEETTREGRSGEGAHSAMKQWLHEERNRIKRPEH